MINTKKNLRERYQNLLEEEKHKLREQRKKYNLTYKR